MNLDSKKILIVNLFILMLCGSIMNSCGSSYTSSLQYARTEFEEIIDEFDAQGNEVDDAYKEGKKVLITFNEAIRKAKDKDEQFAIVHNEWEAVGVEVKKLHEKFKQLVETADQFYVVVERKCNSIQGEELREKKLKEFEQNKQRYIHRLKSTKSKIDDLDTINIKVKDTITALEISYSLDVLEQEMNKTFEEIDKMISSVMQELDRLSKESKDLLNLRYGD